METINFFKDVPLMRGYRGDTFPEFEVVTDLSDPTGYSMRLVLENAAVPGSVALTKSCTLFSDGTRYGFNVQLLSTETAALLPGTYRIHFILTSPSELDYRKLVGSLQVLDIPQEVES